MIYTQISLFDEMEIQEQQIQAQAEILEGYNKNNARLTAIARKCHNVPYKYFLENDVITKEKTVLDYGCGRGFDVEHLKGNSYDIQGFDLYQEAYNKPELLHSSYDVVTCNYVINVISEKKDIVEVIKNCYELAKEKVCFAVRMDDKAIKENWKKTPNGGWLTPKGTYQKFYNKNSFYELMTEVLGTEKLKDVQWFGNSSQGHILVINK